MVTKREDPLDTAERLIRDAKVLLKQAEAAGARGDAIAVLTFNAQLRAVLNEVEAIQRQIELDERVQ